MDLDSIMDKVEYKRFLEKFLLGRENEERNNITMISSACELLVNEKANLTPEEYKECVNRIMISCCSIMKMTELYTRLIKVLFDSDIDIISVDMNRFLNELREKCNETLGVASKVIFNKTDDLIYADTNVDFMEYILLGCVRKAVLDGAVTVEIALEQLKNKDMIVTVRTVESDPADSFLRIFKDITTDELMSINTTLAEKIGCSFTCEDDVMRLHIKYKRSGTLVLKEPSLSYQTRIFTSVHNMLADLSGYKFF